MRLSRVQFTVRRNLVLIGLLAILFACWDSSRSWWTVKPAFNIIFVPIVALVLAVRKPERRSVLLAICGNGIFLLLWFVLRRPPEGMTIGQDYPEYVKDAILMAFTREDSWFSTRIRSLYDWLAFKGTIPDLVSISG